MQWVFLYNAPDKYQVIEECIKDYKTFKCINKVIHENILWTIWFNTENKKRTIELYLLSKYNCNWGYKRISDEIEFIKYDCPLKFLEIVPGYNDWRERVKQYHNNINNKKNILKFLEVGKIVRLKDSNPNELYVTSIKPLQGIANNGREYKIKKINIIEVL